MTNRMAGRAWTVTGALLLGALSAWPQAQAPAPAQPQAPAPAQPQAPAPAQPQPSAQRQALQGPEVEAFLKNARIVSAKELGKGITLPLKAELELDGVKGTAVFKSIDDKPNRVVQTDAGPELEFQDSWRTEVAAYELDQLIGLGMVPATVERDYRGKPGSLQLWAESMMDEGTRTKKKIAPPNPQEWNNQVATLRIWDALIYNTDRNLGNVLITSDWRIIAIDHSRSFRPFAQLKDPKSLKRFSRSLLARLETLDEATLKAKLDRYLTEFQINGLLKRRDAIEALAKKLVAEQGEAAVLYK